MDRGASQINQTTPPNLLAHIRARHARFGAGVRGWVLRARGLEVAAYYARYIRTCAYRGQKQRKRSVGEARERGVSSREARKGRVDAHARALDRSCCCWSMGFWEEDEAEPWASHEPCEGMSTGAMMAPAGRSSMSISSGSLSETSSIRGFMVAVYVRCGAWIAAW